MKMMSLPHQYQNGMVIILVKLKTRRTKMGAYDCDCINNLEYERSKRREKLFHITPQKPNGCILTEFGDCSYVETECSNCAIKKKIREALSAKESTENELKPCPFCGGEAEMCSGSDRLNGKHWYIRCKSCFSRGAEYYESFNALMENEEFFAIQKAWKNAIKAWNKRIIDKQD